MAGWKKAMSQDKDENKRGRKLYYYLSRMEAREVKDFHAYLESPILGNSPQMARMLRTIQREVLNTERKSIDADLFGEEFFPTESLDEGKRKYIRIRLVQMHTKLLDFIAFQEYRRDKNAQDLNLLKGMYKRGLSKYFEKTYAEINSSPPVREFGEYEDYCFRRATVMNEFLSVQDRREGDMYLGEVNRTVDAAYIKNKLRYASSLISIDQNSTTRSLPNFGDDVLCWAEQAPYNSSPTIRIMKESYLSAKAFENKAFEECERHINHTVQLLYEDSETDRFETLEISRHMITLCLGWAQMGIAKLLPVIREMFSFQLNRGLILEAGLIGAKDYKAITNTMLRVGEIQWIESFIEQWRYKVFADDQGLSYYHNLAAIKLAKREYDAAIELLYNRIHLYQDSSYALGGRIFLCRAIWEKGDLEWLKSSLQAFRLFLARTKSLSPATRTNHQRFVAYFTRLCDASMLTPEKCAKRLRKLQADMERFGGRQRFVWLSGAIDRKLLSTIG